MRTLFILFVLLGECSHSLAQTTSKQDSTMQSSLKNLTVTGHKKLISYSPEGPVAHVAGTILGKYKDIKSVLLAIPGLTPAKNNEVEVFRRGTPVVYINRRRTRSEQEWKQLDPKEIRTIQLITNPGAEYDAGNSPVLKITTVRQKGSFSFKAGHESQFGEHYSHNEEIRAGFYGKKLSLSANYTYMNIQQMVVQPVDQTIFSPDGHTQRFRLEQLDKRPIQDQPFSLQAEYAFNERQQIGISADGDGTDYKMFRATDLRYDKDETPLSTSAIGNNTHSTEWFYHLNAYHHAKWSKRLSTDFTLDYAADKGHSNQTTREDSPENGKKTSVFHSPNTLRLYAGRLAAEYQKNDWLHLAFGTEFTSSLNQSKLQSNTEDVPSADTHNTERRSTTFAEWTMTQKAWTLRLGLKYEYSYLRYSDRKDPSQSFSKRYHNLHPSLLLTYAHKDWNHSLSFTSRTVRPSFGDLTNDVYYTNEYMVQQGNPQLQPSTIYNAEWQSNYRFLTLTASYTYTKDLIYHTQELEGKRILSTIINYPHIQTLQLGASLQKSVGIWSPTLSIGYKQPFFQTMYLGEKLTHNHPVVQISTNQQLTLPKQYLLSLYYMVKTPGNYQAAVKMRTIQTLNLSLQKSFWHERLILTLSANDLFRTLKYREDERIGYLHFQQTEDYREWNYSLSVVFRLNKKTASYKGQNTLDSEIGRM